MTRRARYLSALPIVLLASSFAHAKDITPYDAYYQAKAVDLSNPASSAPNGFISSVDAQRGTPTFFWAQRGAPLPAGLAGASSERIATHHLKAHASLWGLTPAALATAKPVRPVVAPLMVMGWLCTTYLFGAYRADIFGVGEPRTTTSWRGARTRPASCHGPASSTDGGRPVIGSRSW